jgi:hypothetical protein
MDGQTIETTLSWLFEKYLENPNKLWNISEVSGDNVEHTHHLGRLLANKGYVKNHEAFEDGFTCTITALGISRVSDDLNEVKYRILQASIEQKKRSMMEILEISPDHYQKAFDFANHLKRIGMIECIFHSHDVYAEPTYFGKEWYEANKTKLIN